MTTKRSLNISRADESSLARLILSVMIQDTQTADCSAQLRFERHPSVHKVFPNIGGVSRIIEDNAKIFCQPSFYRIKPPAIC